MPIRADFVEELTAWQADLGKVDGKAKLFRVPAELVKILNRDSKLAGIPKVDDDGRTVVVHALRHTTGTFLQRGGVAPKAAQRLMRHSDIRLTLDRHADVTLLNTEGALDALRSFKRAPAERQRATGTYDAAGVNSANSLAVPLGVPLGVSGCVSQPKRAKACTKTTAGVGGMSKAQTVVGAGLSKALHNH